MAGHSKWANIKHKKAKNDSKKGAIFTKMAREIMVAAKTGGADPDTNFRLRTAIQKAKSEGLPNDNIKRAIEKAQGAGADGNLEEITYEGYGSNGIAILAESVTDNRNRTAGDIRSYFNKNKGNLGETGCVGWMFEEQGVISIKKDGVNQEKLFEYSIEAGAEDFIDEDDLYTVVTAPDDLESVSNELEKKGYSFVECEVTKNPQNTIKVEDEESAKYLLRLLDSIESHDDVQKVYSNFEMDDELIEKVSS